MNLNGNLVQDSFYNGDHTFGLLVGINRFSPAVFRSGFDLQLLPLRKDAPIYLSGWPTFTTESFVQLQGVDVLQTFDVAFTVTM